MICWQCFSNAALDGVGHLCCKGALLAHAYLGVDQESSVASLQSFFPAGWPPACTGAWDYSSSCAGLDVVPLLDVLKLKRETSI